MFSRGKNGGFGVREMVDLVENSGGFVLGMRFKEGKNAFSNSHYCCYDVDEEE